MLRRISLIAASVAMLAISALPASAATATTHASTTHKIAFPALRGVKAWGTYTKTSKGVKLYVCDEDTVSGVYASGAVALAYNTGWKLHTNGGAVAVGYGQTVCRSVLVHYTTHLMVYTATWTKTGRVSPRSPNTVLSCAAGRGRPRRAAAAGR